MTSPHVVLHPPLVHFPIAFWILAAALDWVLPFQSFLTPVVTFTLVGLGLLGGIAAILTGFVEGSRLSERHPARRTLYAHIAGAASAFGAFALAFALRLGAPEEAASLIARILETVGLIAIVAAGSLGGKLVYDFGVGRRPSSSRSRNDEGRHGSSSGSSGGASREEPRHAKGEPR